MIGFVGATTTLLSGSLGTITQALNLGGADFLVVWFDAESSETVTTVTYNAVSLTQVSVHTIPNIARKLYCYVLHAPASGSNNLIVTVTHIQSPGVEVLASWYSGVVQADSVDAHQETDISGSGNQTVTVNVVIANSWLVCCVYDFNAVADGTVSGTKRDTSDAYGANNIYFEDSNATVGSGNQTIGWHQTVTSNKCSFCAISLAPVAVASDKFFAFF